MKPTIEMLQKQQPNTTEIVNLGGICHGADSYNRELWVFENKFAQRTIGEESDEWTSEADQLEGWFPDYDPEDWIDLLL